MKSTKQHNTIKNIFVGTMLLCLSTYVMAEPAPKVEKQADKKEEFPHVDPNNYGPAAPRTVDDRRDTRDRRTYEETRNYAYRNLIDHVKACMEGRVMMGVLTPRKMGANGIMQMDMPSKTIGRYPLQDCVHGGMNRFWSELRVEHEYKCTKTGEKEEEKTEKKKLLPFDSNFPEFNLKEKIKDNF